MMTYCARKSDAKIFTVRQKYIHLLSCEAMDQCLTHFSKHTKKKIKCSAAVLKLSNDLTSKKWVLSKNNLSGNCCYHENCLQFWDRVGGGASLRGHHDWRFSVALQNVAVGVSAKLLCWLATQYRNASITWLTILICNSFFQRENCIVSQTAAVHYKY